MYGLVEGKRHDSAMLAESWLLDQMQLHCNDANGHPFYVYGDVAYPLGAHLQKPFQGARLNDQQKEFNSAMSSVRTSVEWLFVDVINYFKFMDFKENLKIGLSPLRKMYVVCAILQNARAILYGNTTSNFFQKEPPNLNEYFL